MSKFLKIAFLSFLAIVSITSCSKRKTYADYLREERKAISNFIRANNIDVQYSKPTEWVTDDGREIYFRNSSGLYYHQIEQGAGPVAPTLGSTVLVRYIGKTLFGTVMFDRTGGISSDPHSFVLISNPNPNRNIFGIGFQEAVTYMRAGGHCKVIIPFTIGNGTNITVNGTLFSDAANYIPMFYEIWLIRVE